MTKAKDAVPMHAYLKYAADNSLSRERRKATGMTLALLVLGLLPTLQERPDVVPAGKGAL